MILSAIVFMASFRAAGSATNCWTFFGAPATAFATSFETFLTLRSIPLSFDSRDPHSGTSSSSSFASPLSDSTTECFDLSAAGCSSR